MSAIADGADRAVWEKITKGRIRWDNVVEKKCKESGDQEEVLPIEKFGGCKTEVKGRTEERDRLALRNKVKEEKLGGGMGG